LTPAEVFPDGRLDIARAMEFVDGSDTSSDAESIDSSIPYEELRREYVSCKEDSRHLKEAVGSFLPLL
jgi:hypothetical protein